MRALLQRVTDAAVWVDGVPVAEIGHGLLVLVGVQHADSAATADWMAERVLGLRIFADADKPMNRSVVDVAGDVLVVSQFTLVADTSRGRRPSFTSAAPPAQAEALYHGFVERLQARWPRIATGRFGADMQVRLTNDGPVTFLLER